MIGGFFKKDHGWDVEGVVTSVLRRLVNFISKCRVLNKRKFTVLLNILMCGKKLKFVRVGYVSRVGLQKDIYSEGGKVMAHLFCILGVELIANWEVNRFTIIIAAE